MGLNFLKRPIISKDVCHRLVTLEINSENTQGKKKKKEKKHGPPSHFCLHSYFWAR
jgi:hypothetical protein